MDSSDSNSVAPDAPVPTHWTRPVVSRPLWNLSVSPPDAPVVCTGCVQCGVELTGNRPDAAQKMECVRCMSPVLTRTQAEYTERTGASEGVRLVANPSH